jgi:hypothetical protein
MPHSCNTMNVPYIPSTSTPSFHLEAAMILQLPAAPAQSKTGTWDCVSKLCTNPLHQTELRSLESWNLTKEARKRWEVHENGWVHPAAVSREYTNHLWCVIRGKKVVTSCRNINFSEVVLLADFFFNFDTFVSLAIPSLQLRPTTSFFPNLDSTLKTNTQYLKKKWILWDNPALCLCV